MLKEILSSANEDEQLFFIFTKMFISTRVLHTCEKGGIRGSAICRIQKQLTAVTSKLQQQQQQQLEGNC